MNFAIANRAFADIAEQAVLLALPVIELQLGPYQMLADTGGIDENDPICEQLAVPLVHPSVEHMHERYGHHHPRRRYPREVACIRRAR
jgi:hypothetical protein